MTKIRQEIVGYVGPMLGGKTAGLLELISASAAVGENVFVVKPLVDDRFPATEIRSRAGGFAKAVSLKSPFEILNFSNDCDLVAIDEAQFFDPCLADVILHLSENKTRVAFSGLNRDFRGESFPTISAILPLVTRLEISNARCTYPVSNSKRLCGAEAQMTQRLINGKPAPYDSPVVVIEHIGQEITYTARCLDHWQVPNLPNRLIRSIK